jgi:hypothetical protein
MLKKYNKFILESLLLEAQLIYKPDFMEIVNQIKMDNWGRPEGEVANFLLKVLEDEVDLVHNYIDTTNTDGLVSFIPEDKIDYNNVVVNLDRVIFASGTNSLLNTYKIPIKGLISSSYNLVNSFKLLKTIKCDDRKEDGNYRLQGYVLYYLQNNVDKDKFTVAYKAPNSYSPLTLTIPENRRGDVKLGRFINKLVEIYSKKDGVGSITASDIEKFVNLYNAAILFKKDIFKNFEIVKGDDIKKWYHESKYCSDNGNYGGQLNSSCMRFASCQSYFKIYTDNPDVCQLLILKDKEGKKIMGRALLWNTIDGRKFMDRIYTNRDTLINVFLQWAKDNDYIAKNKNERFFTEKITVKVKPELYSRYPYMDTLIAYYPNKGILSTEYDLDSEYPDIRPRTNAEKIKGLFKKIKNVPLIFRLGSTDGAYLRY